MSQRLVSSLALAAFCAAALGCGKREGAQPPAPSVVVAPVEKRDVEIYSEWVGTTTGNVNAQIYPKIQGYLQKQAYTNGGVVKANDLLFQIDPSQFQAARDQALGQLQRSQAMLGKTEQDVTRYTPLAATGAISQQELDDAIQARLGARAEVASAKAALEAAQLNLGWTQVKSPIDGVAAIASAQVGDLVSPETLLTSVSQLEPIKVSFPVSEIEYMRFAPAIAEQAEGGHPSNDANLQLILADNRVYPEAGRFGSANLAVSQTTGTILIQVLFANPKNLLRPGQFAKVRAVTERIPNALVIPQRAVRDVQGVSQVAVVGADDKIAFTKVKLGAATGSDYVVASGLAEGDRIVVEGLQKVRDGLVVAASALPPVAAPPPPPSPAVVEPGK